MPDNSIALCDFKSYRAIYRPDAQVLPFRKLLARLTTHERTESKDSVRLFAPVRLQPVADDQCKHAREEGGFIKAHRCDASVAAVTCLVFDADQGDERDIQRCHARLKEADISHVFYSTFSYSPLKDKAAYRLVVFTAREIKPEEFKSLRLNVIAAFEVPCDPGSSAGISHSYYWPAAKPTATVSTLQHIGGELNVDQYKGVDHAVTKKALFVAGEHSERKCKPAPDVLRREALAWAERERGFPVLHIALSGAPLAEPGGRHAAVMKLRSKLCGRFTDVDPESLYELVADSLAATSVAGRDLSLEFADGIEEYQDRLFAQDEEAIEALRPAGYKPPAGLVSAEGEASALRRIRAVFSGRAEEYKKRGDLDKARVATAIHRQTPLPTHEIGRAVWMVTAVIPDYPIKTYVEALEKLLSESTIGVGRLRQLVTEAIYKQVAQRQADDQFELEYQRRGAARG